MVKLRTTDVRKVFYSGYELYMLLDLFREGEGIDGFVNYSSGFCVLEPSKFNAQQGRGTLDLDKVISLHVDLLRRTGSQYQKLKRTVVLISMNHVYSLNLKESFGK